MGKYSNLKFFDSNSDELNLNYDSDAESWSGMVYLPEVSVGLYETLTIFMFETVKGSFGETKYVKPITPLASGSNDNILINFEGEYDSSGDITLYSTTLESGELYVSHEGSKQDTRSPQSIVVIPAPNPDFDTVLSTVKNEPIQINIALNSEEESYHKRTLKIHEVDSSGSITHTIATIGVYGETVGEDERLETLLSNIGMSLSPTDHFVFEDADIRESSPDWQLINRKRRELLLEAANIKPFIGTYKALLNAIKYFGYENITLKEYWLNINETAENFGKLKAVAVPNQDVKGFLAAKNSTGELPNSNQKKTSRFSLVYRLNNATGEYDEWDIPKVKEALEFSPDEVLIKLYGLKNRLQKSYIPMHAKIVDIVGEGDYFSQFNLNTWNNQQNIYTVNEGVDVGYDVFPDRGLYLEDLRKVSPHLTGLGQDFEALSTSDLGAYWKIGDISNYPDTVDERDYNNNMLCENIGKDKYSTDSPNDETVGSIAFPQTAIPFTPTTLAVDCTAGDATVTVADATGWEQTGMLVLTDGIVSNGAESIPYTSVNTTTGVVTLQYGILNNFLAATPTVITGHYDIPYDGHLVSASHPDTTSEIKPTSQITACVWAKLTEEGHSDHHTYAIPVTGWGVAGPSRTYTMMSNSNSGGWTMKWEHKRFIVSLQSGGNTITNNSGTSALTADYNTFNVPSGVDNTDWHMFSFTFDGRYTRLYIDGVPAPNSDVLGNPNGSFFDGVAVTVGNAKHDLGSYGHTLDNGLSGDLFIGQEPNDDVPAGVTTEMNWVGNISNAGVIGRALTPDEMLEVYNGNMSKYFGYEGTTDYAIESFYNGYDDMDLSTFSELETVPVGSPIILEVNSLVDTFDDCSFTWEEGEIEGENQTTWEKWWHRGVYEIEWRILGPNNYDRSFKGQTHEYYKLPLTLPYIGEYSIELSLYDLYNVRSVKFDKQCITVKSKEVETYGVTQVSIDSKNWNEYLLYDWDNAGSDWNTACENEEEVQDFIGSYYLTMDRANYVNNNDDWRKSTMVRYEDTAQDSGFSESSGPYAWRNLTKHTWNNGETTSWESTQVGSDINPAFSFDIDDNTNVSIQVNYYENGVLLSDTFTSTIQPTGNNDITGWENIATELNSLSSATNPHLSKFTFNAIVIDGTPDTCDKMLAVANNADKMHDIAEDTNDDAVIITNGTLLNYNMYIQRNPTYDNSRVINQHEIFDKLNHFTFSYDNSKVPGILNQEWTLKNNSKTIEDIYYNNRWLTYVFDEEGDYTLDLKLTDVNGNEIKTTKNILTIK
jgi:hypothetical protein